MEMSTIRKRKLVALAAFAVAIVFLIFWQRSASVPGEREYRQQAQELANRQDWNGLEELTKRWATHHPDSGVMHAARADVFRMRGQYATAADEYDKALAIEKDQPQLLVYLGISLLETGNYRRAQEACRTGTTLATQFPDGWYCLSLASAEMDDPQTMQTALAALKQLKPDLHQTAARIIHDHICPRKTAKPAWCE